MVIRSTINPCWIIVWSPDAYNIEYNFTSDFETVLHLRVFVTTEDRMYLPEVTATIEPANSLHASAVGMKSDHLDIATCYRTVLGLVSYDFHVSLPLSCTPSLNIEADQWFLNMVDTFR